MFVIMNDVMHMIYAVCHILNYVEDESWTAFHSQRLSGSLKMSFVDNILNNKTVVLPSLVEYRLIS